MLLPQHLAFIPDGNRRWAKKKGLPSFMGHREGAKSGEEILLQALKNNIPNVTFWGTSVDNVVKRDPEEVSFLFRLFEDYFKALIKKKVLYEREIRVRILGSWEKCFPEKTKQALYAVQEATRNHTKANLTFLLAYSGIVEMTEAIRAIAQKGISAFEITSEIVKRHLYTAEIPPVDFVVRTGGEPHFSSGFMMWDVADAQLYFTETLWPDFSKEELTKALEEYARRERRKGK